MKKILSLFLAMLLAFSLCACGTTPAPGTTTEAGRSDTQNTTAGETTVPSGPVQLPMSAISMPIKMEETTAEDGTILFTYTYQDVSLIAPDAETAESIVLNLLHEQDAGYALASTTLQWAESDYTESGNWIPYFCQILYNPTRIDEKVLSLQGSEVTYSGGTHPNQVGISANFDMATGALLTLKDILIDNNAATALSQYIIENLTANKEVYQLYDGYAAVINQRFGGDKDLWMENSSWYFSHDGLCIYFSPYDIAPYVVGTITVELPYETLTGILKDDFMLPELPDASGQVSIALAQDVDLEQYTQFAEAILDADGERFILYSDDMVTNICLEQGSFDESGTVFTASATVFAANTLCAGDAIMVHSFIPDTMPNLRLRYESGGTVYTRYITQSGEDGSMLLMDAQ